MHESYRIHEFAELAGVTVKALHHYDRLGLLKPRRTDAGYRVYAAADLERLEQIVALKFIGLPLRDIRTLLDRGSPPLADALRLQRQVLEDKRRRIDRAIEAIATAEEQVAGGQSQAPVVLQRLIEAISAEARLEILQPYFGDAAWARWKTRRAPVAGREWSELYRQIEAAMTEDATGPRARAVAERWLALVETEVGGDASIRTGLIKAWTDGHRLPALLHSALDDAGVARATRWVANVLWSKWEAERRAQPAAAAPHKASDSRLALFRRAEALLDREPADPEVQALVGSWNELLEREAGGDPESIRMLRLSLARRASWPDGMRHYVASLYGTTPETWERVAGFLERAGHEAR